MRTENNVIDVVAYFRTQHHAVAKMIAMGMSDSMIMRNTGLSQRRLTLLKRDVAFTELVKYYADLDTTDMVTNRDPYYESMWGNMVRAEAGVTEHLERAEESGELIPIQILNRISQDRADRLGYSKHSVIHHDHDFASALDRAIARSKTVTLVAEEVVALPDVAPPSAPEPVVAPPEAPSLPQRQPARPSLASTFKRRI
jgi:hypothetical protein